MDTCKAQKYMELAKFQADLFSKDPDTRVACIILDPVSLQILSTGFNGMCRGVRELPERWRRPAKYTWVAHAEANAVANAARVGVRLEGSVGVVTLFPCAECCKMLVQAGIKALVAPEPDLAHPRWGDDFAVTAQMLHESGVQVTYM